MQTSRNLLLLLALAALMVLTRSHHFAAATYLPDASLAVFFLAGWYLPARWVFPVLLLVAGLADYWAIGLEGVSAACMSPAYWFLIPTYACPWYGGRWAAGCCRLDLKGLSLALAILLAATSLAFLVSNASFFWFSGNFAEMSAAEYAGRVARYYLPYLTSALVYAIGAFALHLVIAALMKNRVRHHGI